MRSPGKLLAALLLVSCGGGGTDVSPPPPPPPAPGPVASVAITPDSSDLAIGDSKQLVATVKDAAGNTLQGRTLSWSVSNPSIASVSATGLVTAVVPGRVTLTASAEGQAGNAVVRAVAPADTLPGLATGPAVTAIPLRASPPLVPAEFTTGAPSLPKAAVSYTTVLLLIAADATLAQLNALLRLVHGQIAAGSPGVAGQVPGILTVRLPTTSHADMAAALTLLRQQPIVLRAQPDIRLTPLSIPAPNALPSIYQWTWELMPSTANWSLEAIRAPQLWNLNEAVRKSGNRTVSAVFDVGFFASEDLLYERQYASSYTHTHGTHVAGIIAAGFNNGKGIDGMNPFARLFSAGGFETLSSLVTDFRIFLDSVPTARVVNVSMGYNTGDNQENTTTDLQAQQRADTDGDFVTAVLRAIASTRALPVIVVAAGNDSDDFPNQQTRYSSPYANASIRGAAPIIVVEGLENNFATGTQSRADYSNSGGHLSAPGSAILSTVGATDYNAVNGTSQAAPFVAGLVSYLMALDPTLPSPTMTSNPVRDLLVQTGRTVTGTTAPMLDAFAAALEVDKQQGNDKVLRALLDIDDGTLDGNTRVGPDAANEDADGNGGQGDGSIDMADFRRWRDWFLQIDGDPALQLDGPATHLKRDLNGDGLVEAPAKEGVFPRGDFNGDGRLDLTSDAPMTGALTGQRLTDLQVLRARFVDPDYHETVLPSLMRSGDITIDAARCFNRPGVAAVLTEIKLVSSGTTLRARVHRAVDGLQEFTEHVDGAGHSIVVQPLDQQLNPTDPAESIQTVLAPGDDFLYTPCASLDNTIRRRSYVGDFYRIFLLAPAGCTTTPTWTISAGGLPPGILLDGLRRRIEGPPTTVGVYPFTVSGDCGNVRGDLAETITVVPGPVQCSPGARESATILNQDSVDAIAGVSELSGRLFIGMAGNVTLPSLRCVGGRVEVRSPGLTSLDLPSLQSTGGRLTIGESFGGNAVLTRVSMPALRSVGGRIEIGLNPQLMRVDLPSLNFVEANTAIFNNPKLSQLTLGPAFYYSGISIIASDLNSLGGLAGGMYLGHATFLSNPRLCAGAINAFAAIVTFENGGGVRHDATC